MAILVMHIVLAVLGYVWLCVAMFGDVWLCLFPSSGGQLVASPCGSHEGEQQQDVCQEFCPSAAASVSEVSGSPKLWPRIKDVLALKRSHRMLHGTRVQT